MFEHEGSVWSVGPRGDHLRRLTFDSDDTASFAPSYAPSGTAIVFSRFTPRGNVDLYTMNPDGSRMRALTRTRADRALAPVGSVLLLDSSFRPRYPLAESVHVQPCPPPPVMSNVAHTDLLSCASAVTPQPLLSAATRFNPWPPSAMT